MVGSGLQLGPTPQDMLQRQAPTDGQSSVVFTVIILQDRF